MPLVDDLQKFEVTSECLRCAEYSFQLAINPCQHPKFDSNIFRLLYLLRCLCNTCGGVIYLTREGDDKYVEGTFERFKESLFDIIAKNPQVSRNDMELVEISLNFGIQQSWAALILLAAKAVFQTGLCLTPRGDVYEIRQGNVDECQLLQQRSLESPPQLAEESNAGDHMAHFDQNEPRIHTLYADNPSFFSGECRSAEQSEHLHKDESNNGNHPTNTAQTSPENIPEATGSASPPAMDYSAYRRVSWTNNKSNWQSYVNIKKIETERLLTKCDMLKPALPMRRTPCRDQLQYMFTTEEDMEHVLATCTTDKHVPSFAIACKSWRSIVTNSRYDTPPTGHICDILTVTAEGRICFWVIVANYNVDLNSVRVYLMTTGRMIKYQLARNGQQNMRQFYIQCGISSPDVSMQTSFEVESAEMQDCFFHLFPKKNNFTALQRALAVVILSRESPLRRCGSDQTSILLSAEQADKLMHRGKVNYICGAAGSGKSWIAAELYRMHGREQSVYICSTDAFAKYLEYNGHTGTPIKCDQDLIVEIEKGTFQNKTCVIIDDSHRLPCSTSSMEVLFHLLRDNREMALFVFADNDYQSFEKHRQLAMYDCFQHLTRKIMKQPLIVEPLTEVYRNTRKVVSFIQSAVNDIQDRPCKI